MFSVFDDNHRPPSAREDRLYDEASSQIRNRFLPPPPPPQPGLWGLLSSSRLGFAFFVVGAALSVLTSLAFALVVVRGQQQSLVAETRQRLHDAAVLLADEFGDRFDAPRDAKLQESLKRLGERTSLRATLINAPGVVLADSQTDPAALDNHRGRPEIVAARASPNGEAFVDRTEGGERTVYVVQRLDRNGEELGYVRLASSLAGIDSQTRFAYTAIGVIALVGAALAALLAWGLLRRPVQALRHLELRIAALSRPGGRAAETAAGGFSIGPTCDEVLAVTDALDGAVLRLRSEMDALRHHRERLATVLEGMIEGVVAVDREERVLFANEAASRLLEFSESKSVGRPLWEVMRHPPVQDAVREALGSPKPTRSEFTIPRTGRRAAIHGARLPGEPCPGVVVVLHDVTELRKLENLRQEFVANVSHELKTPLTAIQVYAETLLNGGLDDPENRETFVKRIEEQAERLHQLIMDVLSLARIEANPHGLAVDDVSLNDVLTTCVNAHAGTASAKSVTLTLHAPEREVIVVAEEEGLRTIFDNLIDNAFKYTPTGGRVDVRARIDPDAVQIDVSDTGVGIAPEHHPRIFERFYRVDHARSRELGGTGLGLSIVKHLVQAFDGTVAVSSQLGHGSTFSIRLPRATSPVEPKVASR